MELKLEWSGVEWSWSGVGVEWSGVEWSGDKKNTKVFKIRTLQMACGFSLI